MPTLIGNSLKGNDFSFVVTLFLGCAGYGAVAFCLYGETVSRCWSILREDGRDDHIFLHGDEERVVN